MGRHVYVGDVDRAAQVANSVTSTRNEREAIAALKRKREAFGDASVLEGNDAYQGPWAKYQKDVEPVLPPSGSEGEETDTGDEDDAYELSKTPRKQEEKKEKSVFHGSSMYDYLGRSFMHVPQDLDINLDKDPGEQTCFIPKKCIQTWNAHPQGVTTAKFFPRHGHLLLSAGMDSKVKIWDCFHDRELLRSYSGHSKTVGDICFSNDGRQFLSASYDKMIKLWDTETGQVVNRFTTGKIPNCVKFNPLDGNEFLAGMSDKKIVQFDVRTGEVEQEYDHHLGPVNTITFVDENRRFMTTSDDKSMRVWEYGIPVPIKFVADPTMQSMPSVALHPSGRYVAAQSLDNEIVVFQAEDKFRRHRRKAFKGHGCGGYAVQVNFSPDGRFLISGDAGGFACFWGRRLRFSVRLMRF